MLFSWEDTFTGVTKTGVKTRKLRKNNKIGPIEQNQVRLAQLDITGLGYRFGPLPGRVVGSAARPLGRVPELGRMGCAAQLGHVGFAPIFFFLILSHLERVFLSPLTSSPQHVFFNFFKNVCIF